MVRRATQRVALLLFSFFLFFLPAALAQNDRAGVTGRVTDSSGAVISGATVKITNTATGQEVDLTTNADGNYSQPTVLQPGPYRVEASRQGFKTQNTDVTLQIGDVREVNFTMVPGATTETVNVTSEAPLLQTETSDRGEVITGRQITQLPLNGRNFTELATLAPGVTRAYVGTVTDQSAFNQGDPNAGSVNGLGDARGNTPAARFSRSGGSSISANGLRPTENNFTLDGVDNNEPQYQNIGVFPNPDAIQEFQIETSVAKAETGRGGATVNTRYESGTNQFHGKLYYYGQNDALNATPSIIRQTQAQLEAKGMTAAQAEAQIPKTSVRVHEFGGTFGGPIFKDRTFFFGDYLGQRNKIPNFFRDAVPTTGSRLGDFSAFCLTGFTAGLCNDRDSKGNPINQLKDPATGKPFLNNVIPNLQSLPQCSSTATTQVDCFNKQAFTVLNMFPQPNIPNVLIPNNSTNPNFAGVRKNEETIDSYDFKIDHRLFGQNQLTARYSNSDQVRKRANFFPGLPTAGFGAGDEVGNARQFVVSDTEPFTPSLLNELRAGYTRIQIGILNCGAGGACGTSATYCNDVGIPNCNKGTFDTSGGLGFAPTGTGETEFLGDGGPLLVTSYNFYIADSVSLTHGNHSFKVGTEIRPRTLQTICGGCAGFLKGAIGYGPGASGNAQAQALLGQNADFSQSATISGNDQPFELHTIETGIFAQDDWKVNPTLTLNLGLRYDIFPAFNEAQARLANYDPAGRVINQAKDSSDRLVNTRYNNIAPRVGFAKSFGSRQQFVWRGGYGIFYTQDSYDYYPLVQNPPLNASIFCGGPGCPPVVNLATGPPVASITGSTVVTGSSNLRVIPRDQKTETVQEYNLTFQWQIARDYLLDLGYVGTQGRHLLAARQLGTSGNGLGSALAPDNSHIGNVIADEARSNSGYNALQAHLEKRFSYGLVGGVSYTYGHGIDDSTGIFNGPGDTRGNAGGPINPFNFRVDRGNSTLDHRHVFVANGILDLPFGHGRRFAANTSNAVDYLIGGWQLNTVFNASSGQHFSVDADNGGGVKTYAILIPGADPYAHGTGLFLNPASFLAPTALNGATCVTNLAGNQICYGNSGRNRFTGPSFARTDLSLFKNVKFTERFTAQLGIEFYNLFNNDNHVIPEQGDNAAITDPKFGAFNNALPPRTAQYRAKIIF